MNTRPTTPSAAEQQLEALRRAAIREGLLDAADPPAEDGIVSAAAATAIEQLLDRMPAPQPPDEAACRRWYAAHGAELAGPDAAEQVELRHILFAVTPGVPVDALRQRAEACLIGLRARGRDAAVEDARFAAAAAELSNCPSGAHGGALGWLRREDCAPEFAREVFGQPEVGVLPRLVASRFGLHVVEVLARRPATVPGYDEAGAAVHAAVRRRLEQQATLTALHGWVLNLLGDDGAAPPLVQ